MRSLLVLVILLGISAACPNQPAATVPPPAGTESNPAAGIAHAIGGGYSGPW